MTKNIVLLIALFFTNYVISKDFKVLNLVLFSKEQVYEQMYHLTRVYYSQFKDVDTFYYVFSSKYDDPTIVGDILYIPGQETYVPGILDKTIKAFSYVQNRFDYDYIIRTNISTIVNFETLTSVMKKNPKDFEYTGGLLLCLDGINERGGIIDDRHFGLLFASGTSIILSNSAMKKLLSKKEYIDYNLIDDVAIGHLFNKYYPEIVPLGLNNAFVCVDDSNKNLVLEYIDQFIFFRNCTSIRQKDVLQMSELIERLNEIGLPE